ncbi:MAG TPA: hypothetical protein VGC99_01345 [Candidatus Tectomicrobia bacterium]
MKYASKAKTSPLQFKQFSRGSRPQDLPSGSHGWQPFPDTTPDLPMIVSTPGAGPTRHANGMNHNLSRKLSEMDQTLTKFQGEFSTTIRRIVAKEVIPVIHALQHADHYPATLVNTRQSIGLFNIPYSVQGSIAWRHGSR